MDSRTSHRPGGEPSAQMPLHAELITERPRLAALASEWDDVLHDSTADTIFLTWQWIKAWLDSVHPNVPLITVIVRDCQGRLTAIAPFYLTTLRFLRVISYRTLRVLGDTFSGSEYADLILRRGSESESMTVVFEALLDQSSRWDCIWMPRVAGWTGARQRFARVCTGMQLHFHERDTDFSVVHLPATYASYFERLSANTRSMLRRRTKSIMDQQGAALVECRTESERTRFLDALFDLNHRRWASVGQLGTFVRNPAVASFYRTFTQAAVSHGWLRLYGLRINGRIQAMQAGYVYCGTFHQLQEGFDPDSPKGIGNVLRGLVIARLIDEGVTSYDFLGGQTEHKRRWLGEQRLGHDFFIGRRKSLNTLLFAKEVWPTGKYLRDCQLD